MNSRKVSARTGSPVGPAIDFEATEAAAAKVIVGSRPIPVSQPLIKTVPNSGWRVPVKLKELSYTINAKSAHDAFNKVQEYLTRNGVIIEPLNIWLHLNLFWLQRVASSQRVVPLPALQALSKEPVSVLIEKDGYGPQWYGRWLWGVAGVYLAVTEDEYLEAEMRLIYAPWNNCFLRKESIGCEDCSNSWVKEYAVADLSSLVKAREFFVNVQNEIRTRQERPLLTFAEAAKTHHWK